MNDVHTLSEGGGVQEEGSAHQTGKPEVQERRQVLEEEEEGGGEMQVGLGDPGVRASRGAWEEEWGTRCCRRGEEEGEAGSGVQW